MHKGVGTPWEPQICILLCGYAGSFSTPYPVLAPHQTAITQLLALLWQTGVANSKIPIHQRLQKDGLGGLDISLDAQGDSSGKEETSAPQNSQNVLVACCSNTLTPIADKSKTHCVDRKIPLESTTLHQIVSELKDQTPQLPQLLPPGDFPTTSSPEPSSLLPTPHPLLWTRDHNATSICGWLPREAGRQPAGVPASSPGITGVPVLAPTQSLLLSQNILIQSWAAEGKEEKWGRESHTLGYSPG